MRIARIARPGAIYDASAAAQSFANFKPEMAMERLLLRKMKRGMLTLMFLSRVVSSVFLGLQIL